MAKSEQEIREYKAKWRREKSKKSVPIKYNRVEVNDKKNLIGERFGRLSVIAFGEIIKQRSFWMCKCDCGTQKLINVSSLLRGATQSCGCLSKDGFINRFIKHGKHRTKEYITWKSIKSRCYNTKNDSYKNYGGRGISVCERWLNSFDNFLNDMGECPSPELTIDRIENNGNYEKSNCRWTTQDIQANNKRDSVKISYQGTILTIAQFARINNIPSRSLYKPKYKNISGENILDIYKNKSRIAV